jgi:DNA-binding PadR family transcriptional regulator
MPPTVRNVAAADRGDPRDLSEPSDRSDLSDPHEPAARYYRNGNRMPLMRAPLTPAVFHILLALADGPLHGYAIMQAVEQSAGPYLPTGPGTIYGSLQRMEENGIVRELPPRGDERRRLFALQPDGRRALEAESRRIVRLAQLVRAKRLVASEA